MAKRQRGFGTITKLPSGRFRARYADPHGRTIPPSPDAIARYRAKNPDDPEGMPKPEPLRHSAPHTFLTRGDAEAWLVDERRKVSAGVWTSPEDRRIARLQAAAEAEVNTFAAYASRWIDERKVKGRPLAPRTRDHYRQLLEDYLAPAFGTKPLDAITPAMVTTWYDNWRPVRRRSHGKRTAGDTAKAHAYALGRAVMNSATAAGAPLAGKVNPFAIRGGGTRHKTGVKRTQVATGEQVKVILEVIRPEWRALVLLALWCGLRYSEAVELRRSDIDLKTRTLKIERAVSRSRTEGVGVKGPKSQAGVRELHIPASVLDDLRNHLRTYVTGRDGLLFPGSAGQHLAPATFYGKVSGSGWYAARDAAGCSQLRFHDLRATGATLMAQQGATEAEIQAFLGDSTPQAAAGYVRAARSRMEMFAGKMDALAKSGEW